LICFNPNAGSNSKKHLDNILGFLENTNLLSEILTTTGRNHCLEYLKNIDEKLYCGIAIVSGDGLMH
jgi:diacylglycerol kinase family enzyme